MMVQFHGVVGGGLPSPGQIPYKTGETKISQRGRIGWEKLFLLRTACSNLLDRPSPVHLFRLLLTLFLPSHGQPSLLVLCLYRHSASLLLHSLLPGRTPQAGPWRLAGTRPITYQEMRGGTAFLSPHLVPEAVGGCRSKHLLFQAQTGWNR